MTTRVKRILTMVAVAVAAAGIAVGINSAQAAAADVPGSVAAGCNTPWCPR